MFFEKVLLLFDIYLPGNEKHYFGKYNSQKIEDLNILIMHNPKYLSDFTLTFKGNTALEGFYNCYNKILCHSPTRFRECNLAKKNSLFFREVKALGQGKGYKISKGKASLN